MVCIRTGGNKSPVIIKQHIHRNKQIGFLLCCPLPPLTLNINSSLEVVRLHLKPSFKRLNKKEAVHKIIPPDQALAIDVRQALMKALKMGLMKAYQVGAFGMVGEINGDAKAKVNEMEAEAVPCLA